jgi:hypothetical protein
MNTKEKSISAMLNIESDGMDVLAYCVKLMLHKDSLEEILKHLMCSKLDSKELMLACYFLGKIERSQDGERDALTQLYIDREEKLESIEKFRI